jgi:hypothetical protein
MRTMPLVLITLVALSLSPTAARAGANGSWCANYGTGLDGSINTRRIRRASSHVGCALRQSSNCGPCAIDRRNLYVAEAATGLSRYRPKRRREPQESA